LYDIETSPLLLAGGFGLYDQNFKHENIVQDWFIICASWKWYGEDEIYNVSVLDDPKRFKKNHTDDFIVAKKLSEIIQGADFIVAQNGDNFDIKKLGARLIYHGLPPMPKTPSCDTLKEARKFKFTSNRLDYLGQHLCHTGKIETPKGLWQKAMFGDVDAIRTMVEYCDGDIVLLEKVYEKLRPYMTNHPNMNLFQRTEMCCPTCGSPHIVREGYRYTRSTKQQRYKCTPCGAWFYGSSIKLKPVLR
jgi:predicted RNA-binding Zn-ribbon protein involved in translation (DUF1610 family)